MECVRERGRERGRGKGREKCHWLSRKGLALFKIACVREREGEWEREGDGQKRPSPVQNGLCDRERESGRGNGREKCHWLSRKRPSPVQNGLCEREGEWEREGEGQKRPSPVQNGLCERGRGRVGEGRGGKSAIGCPEYVISEKYF